MVSSESRTLLDQESAPQDAISAVEDKRKRNRLMYSVLMVAYIVGGMLFYYLVEGWNPAESLLLILSVLTGVGYGHLVPSGDSNLGMVFTAFYILAGLVLFASIAGQILQSIMQSEINTVMEAVKGGGSDQNDDTCYFEAQELHKKHHFVVGCINLGVIFLGAVLLFTFAFGEDVVHAIYLASVSVYKLDSVCLLDAVRCSHRWHASSGWSFRWLCFAVFWYVLTYGIIGHFLVSATNYLGVDPQASVSKVKTLSHERLKCMDRDGDGHVTRDEFLRDRLIQDGLCDAEKIDAIFQNFDNLDKNRSGRLSQRETCDF